MIASHERPRWEKSEVRFVYFLQEKSRWRLVKIGASNDVAKRFRAIQSAHRYPLTVLGVLRCPDRAWFEHVLHWSFKAYRVRGRREWFHPAEDLMDFITENTVSLADAATAPIYDPGFRRYLPQGEVTEPSYPPNYVFNADGELIDILPE